MCVCVCVVGFCFFFFWYPEKICLEYLKQSGIFGTLVELIVVLEFRKFLEMENNVATTAFKKQRAFGIQMTLVVCPFQLSHIQGTFSKPAMVGAFFFFPFHPTFIWRKFKPTEKLDTNSAVINV